MATRAPRRSSWQYGAAASAACRMPQPVAPISSSGMPPSAAGRPTARPISSFTHAMQAFVRPHVRAEDVVRLVPERMGERANEALLPYARHPRVAAQHRLAAAVGETGGRVLQGHRARETETLRGGDVRGHAQASDRRARTPRCRRRAPRPGRGRLVDMDDLGRAEAINSSEARVHDRVPSASRVPPSTPAIPITCPSWVRPAQRRFRSQWGVPSPCGPRRRATHRGAKGGRHSLSAGRGSCFRESRMPTILDVHRLIVRFADIPVIEDLSFTVADGESLAIIGPSGCGKTVLFKALIGAVPHEGTIRWAPDARVGYVPQKLDLERDLPITGADLLRAKRHVAHAARADVPSGARPGQPRRRDRRGADRHAVGRSVPATAAGVRVSRATARAPLRRADGRRRRAGGGDALRDDRPGEARGRPHATTHLARAEPGVPVRHHRAVPGPGPRLARPSERGPDAGATRGARPVAP